MIVNRTDVVVRGTLVFEIVQVPLEPDEQMADPVVPSLHVPLTSAPAPAVSLVLWMSILTLAVQFVAVVTDTLSRSPTWTAFGGAVTLTVTVAKPEFAVPSDVRYVNVSTPTNPALGV